MLNIVFQLLIISSFIFNLELLESKDDLNDIKKYFQRGVWEFIKKKPTFLTNPMTQKYSKLFSNRQAMVTDGFLTYTIVKFGNLKIKTKNDTESKEFSVILKLKQTPAFKSINGTNGMQVDANDSDDKSNVISCKLTISKLEIKQIGSCGFIINTKSKNQSIKQGKQLFNICKSKEVTHENASECPGYTLASIKKKKSKKHFKKMKLGKAIIKIVKKIAKIAMQSNPGNNDKTVKSTFQNHLKKNLVGFVFKGKKTISSIKSVQVRRIKKQLKVTITFRRRWKLVNEDRQIYKKVAKNKTVTTTCTLSFKKDVKSTCYFNKKEGVMKIKEKGSKVELKMCRFKSVTDLKLAKTVKSAQIDCSDGVITPFDAGKGKMSKSKTTIKDLNENEKKGMKDSAIPKKEGSKESENYDETNKKDANLY